MLYAREQSERAVTTIKGENVAPFLDHISQQTPVFFQSINKHSNIELLNMFTSLSLFFASATLLQLCAAFPPLTDNAVAYLTNCQTSDTGAVYSEVSMYLDVTKSFDGQGPDQYSDTFLGQITTWEGVEVTWSFAVPDPSVAHKFIEFIQPNAQDPAVPTFSAVGCARYIDTFPGGGVANTFMCYKDNPRVLYTTSDHECSTVYYCRITHDSCPLPGEGECP
jgi:hypothetical protein